MTGSLFDQYKAALRRGHVAALEGRLDEALDAYRAAAELVPERALPLASMGTVLHRLDRWPEAADVFDRALHLAPDDEASLRGRAAAREARGLRSGAAADLERLAFVLDVGGRARDAADVARHADALDSTPARSALARRLEAGLTQGATDQAAEATTGPAPEATLEAATEPETRPAPPEAAAQLPPEAEADALDVRPRPRIIPPTAAEEALAARTVDPAQSWPALDMPSPPPPPIVGPPPDPEQVMAEAAAMLEVGNTVGARDRMLTAVAVHRDADRIDAALDVCFQLLALVPGDPQVHLAIANLQLDRGWDALAGEKIALLERLTELTEDTQAAADAHGLAAERLRDQPAAAGSRR